MNSCSRNSNQRSELFRALLQECRAYNSLRGKLAFPKEDT